MNSLTTSSAADARIGSGAAFATVAITVAVVTCILAGWFPLGFSIVAVFLFAGPHNWMEARYLLTRMPGRWGALRLYFLTGLVGVFALATAFAVLPVLSNRLGWDEETWLRGLAIWNTALVLWILVLARMRERQNPRREWSWLVPAGLLLIAAAWLWPQPWDLALVYLHPLMAMWFLDREIGTRRREWQATYRRVVLVVPALLVLLWWRLRLQPSLPGEDALTVRITRHAGAGILAGVSSHLLVSTHLFLEMLHYGIWLVAIPLISLSNAPWRIEQVPLARRSTLGRKFVATVLILGVAAVVGFWAGFLANYPLTRDVYFTVALLHVLAEVPFLLRLL